MWCLEKFVIGIKIIMFALYTDEDELHSIYHSSLQYSIMNFDKPIID